MHRQRRYYSARNASNGEIKLAGMAGTKDETSAAAKPLSTTHGIRDLTKPFGEARVRFQT